MSSAEMRTTHTALHSLLGLDLGSGESQILCLSQKNDTLCKFNNPFFEMFSTLAKLQKHLKFLLFFVYPKCP